MDRYEILKGIGSGNFGVAKLVRDRWSGELFAVKYIERGQKVVFLCLNPWSAFICCWVFSSCHDFVCLACLTVTGVS